MNSTERIAFCKDGLIDCKKKQRSIFLTLPAGIIGVWLINHYFITDAVVSYCLYILFGIPTLWIHINLRRVYASLTEAYEAELDAAKDNQ